MHLVKITKSYIVFILMLTLATLSHAQQDTTRPDGRKGSVRIQVVPCPCDSTQKDSLVLTCADTLMEITWFQSVFDIADSIALAMGVPPGLVYDVGKNESGWPRPYDVNYLIRNGDLQVMEPTFNFMYKRLGLTGGKTRYNYLVIGISYLKYNYDVFGSWKKARYAYGRGHWKPPSQWTALEKKFMGKIDWSKYDKG